MSFDVMLIGSTTTPSLADYARCFDDVLSQVGGSRHIGAEASESGWDLVEIANDVHFEVRWSEDDSYWSKPTSKHGALSFYFRGFSEKAAAVLFRMANSTASYVIDLQSGKYMKTAAVYGDPPTGLEPIETVENERSLLEMMSPSFGSWSDFRDHAIGLKPE
jgi:hypothetical protein